MTQPSKLKNQQNCIIEEFEDVETRESCRRTVYRSLTRAPAASVGDLGQSPVPWLTAITSNTADTGLARALTGHRVTRHSQPTNHVTLTEICAITIHTHTPEKVVR